MSDSEVISSKRADGRPRTFGVRVTLHELVALRTRLLAGGQLKFPLPRRPVFARAAVGSSLSLLGGRGLEFSEVRPYHAGDDVRSIDWRHTARRGRPFTKLFHRERERPMMLCVDQGASMFFGTRVAFKSVQAARSAALLAWSAATSGDQVGGIVCTGAATSPLRPRAREAGVMPLLQQLCVGSKVAVGELMGQTSAGGLAAGLTTLSRVARHGSDLILVSDFSSLDQAMEREITQLATHHRVGLIHVFDRFENEPPPPGIYRMTDGVTEKTLDLRNEAARADWGAAFGERCRHLDRLARKLALPLVRLSTEDDPLQSQAVMNGIRPAGAARTLD